MPKIKYYWQDNPLGKSQLRVRKEMLSRTGYFHSPSDSRTRKNLDRNFVVKYDKEYVFDYIIENIIKNLDIKNEQELLNLIEQAWVYYQNQLKEGSN